MVAVEGDGDCGGGGPLAAGGGGFMVAGGGAGEDAFENIKHKLDAKTSFNPI